MRAPGAWACEAKKQALTAPTEVPAMMRIGLAAKISAGSSL